MHFLSILSLKLNRKLRCTKTMAYTINRKILENPPLWFPPGTKTPLTCQFLPALSWCTRTPWSEYTFLYDINADFSIENADRHWRSGGSLFHFDNRAAKYPYKQGLHEWSQSAHRVGGTRITSCGRLRQESDCLTIH